MLKLVVKKGKYMKIKVLKPLIDNLEAISKFAILVKRELLNQPTISYDISFELSEYGELVLAVAETTAERSV